VTHVLIVVRCVHSDVGRGGHDRSLFGLGQQFGLVKFGL
jgi:hypothetical protein